MPELNTTTVVSKNPLILQLSYGVERANTYIIEDTGHAVIIDACSEKVTEELKRRNVTPDYLILTHEHCDHLWGVNEIRSAFPNVQIIAQNYCSDAIGDPKRNKAKQYHIYATLRFGEGYRNEEAKNRRYACSPAEIVFEEKLKLAWRSYEIEVSHAPGHSPGSVLIHMKDVGIFSGDSVLQEDTFLKFDGGDEVVFNSVTMPMISRISDETVIFPGHGDAFRMREWRENGRATEE